MKKIKLYRICTKCGERKLISNFSKYKNRNSILRRRICKECMSKYKHQHYLKDKVSYLERSKKQRENNPERYKIYLKKYYQKNKDEIRKKHKQYSLTEKGRKSVMLAGRRYRYSHPLETKAHMIISHGIRDGSIIRPSKCSKCFIKCIPEAHHEDYTKPLEVDWVCKHCHESIHHLNG